MLSSAAVVFAVADFIDARKEAAEAVMATMAANGPVGQPNVR